jgi:diadenosine tetraphosphate (Ap4A) HIT family hydrolase
MHVHVLPRWQGDGLMRFKPPARDRPPREELDRQAAAIRTQAENPEPFDSAQDRPRT